MAHNKTDLYGWERFSSKKRVYSRSQKVTNDDDIHNWISKVEAASDKAAAQTFGRKYVGTNTKAVNTVKVRVEDVHLHQAAYAEAQDLLSEWVNEKLTFDVDDCLDDEEDDWARPTQSAAEVKREWDHLLQDCGADEDFLAAPSYRKHDPYSVLEKDSGSEVDSILQNMMQKELIPQEVTSDLGFGDPIQKLPDPRTKMHLRHEQVRKNREKREKEKALVLREQQAKKETQLRARRILQEEERKKTAKVRLEEEKISQEMARIRKDMEEERKQKEELRQRDRREQEELARRASEERMRREQEEIAAMSVARRQEKARERNIMLKMQEIESRVAKQNTRLLQECFSHWYDVALERRMKMGKARAMADWKLLLHAFNGWKCVSRNQRLEKEAAQHGNQLRSVHRKQQQAEHHYQLLLLRRCFTAWHLYIQKQQTVKALQDDQSKTRSKMAAFLHAAAKGSLWQRGDESVRKSSSLNDLTQSLESESNTLNEMFDQKQNLKVQSARSHTSSIDTDRTNHSRCKSAATVRGQANSTGKPTEAWQVNRKHIQLTSRKNENKTSEQGQGDTDSQNYQTLKKPSQQKFTVNNFEHRHHNQQKILENQQKQIQDQQKLIEDLQYMQRHQLLQQQLLMKDQSVDDTGSKLQGHLNKMQKSLIGDAEPNTNNMLVDTDRTEDIHKMPQSTASTARSTTQSSRPASQASTAPSATPSNRSLPSVDGRHTQFAKAMEERALDRKRIKVEREERKRRENEERLAKLQEEENEHLVKEEEEKRKRAEMYKEKKRLAKEKEIEKQKQQQRMQELEASAAAHHHRAIMKFHGWRPMRCLVDMARNNWDLAAKHYQQTLFRKVMLGWHRAVQEEVREKEAMADELQHYLAVKKCFTCWKKLGESANIAEEKAMRHYKQRRLNNVLSKWADWAAEEKIQSWHKERKAREHNIWRIQRNALRSWAAYPQHVKAELKRKQRLEEMRKKVQSLLPDYDGKHNVSVTESRDFTQ